MAKLDDTQGFEPNAPIEASPEIHSPISDSDGETSPPDSPKIHFEPFDRPCTRKEFADRIGKSNPYITKIMKVVADYYDDDELSQGNKLSTFAQEEILAYIDLGAADYRYTREKAAKDIARAEKEAQQSVLAQPVEVASDSYDGSNYRSQALAIRDRIAQSPETALAQLLEFRNFRENVALSRNNIDSFQDFATNATEALHRRRLERGFEEGQQREFEVIEAEMAGAAAARRDFADFMAKKLAGSSEAEDG